MVISCRSASFADQDIHQVPEHTALENLHGIIILSFPICVVQLGKGKPPYDFVSQRWDFDETSLRWKVVDRWGGQMDQNEKSLVDLLPFNGDKGLNGLLKEKVEIGGVVGRSRLTDGTEVVWKVEVVEY